MVGGSLKDISLYFLPETVSLDFNGFLVTCVAIFELKSVEVAGFSDLITIKCDMAFNSSLKGLSFSF